MSNTRVQLTGFANAIKDEVYHRGSAIVRPVNVALADAIPASVREQYIHGAINPAYDADKRQEFERNYDRAQNFLKEQRNLVNNKWLPRYTIKLRRGETEHGDAHTELTDIIVDGCLDRLLEMLVCYSPMLIPECGELAEVQRTLMTVAEKEKARMRLYMDKYAVEYADGVRPLKEDYD